MKDPKGTRVNQRISASEVFLIGPQGEKLGIKSCSEALKIAEELELDLVEVSHGASPPVCKIMDYDKYRYELHKKSKISKKKQKIGTLKEIWMRPSISKHDYDFKLRNIRRFLEEGHKVRIMVKFKGREFAYQDLGYKILEKVRQDIEQEANIETQPKSESKSLIMLISPKKSTQTKKEEVTTKIDDGITRET